MQKQLEELLAKYSTYKVTLKEVITTNNKYPAELDYVISHLSENTIQNFSHLMKVLNIIRQEYNKPMCVSCGFRNPEHNIRVGGSPNSLHCLGGACDIRDPNGELDKWLINHKDFLRSNHIYVEHPFYTKGWAHIQYKAPRSNNTFFIPYVGGPKEKDRDPLFEHI